MRPLDPNLVPAWRRRAGHRRRRRRESSNPAERRAERRYRIANTEVRNHQVAGRVLDLHRDGMSIESDASLRPGRTYTLTLSIGEHIETLDARVLWCRLLRTERQPNGDVTPVYRAGIRTVRPARSSEESGAD